MGSRSLTVLPDRLGIARLDSGAVVPAWALSGSFSAITMTSDELSIVCLEANVPSGVTVEGGWRALKIEGPLDFDEVGIVLSVAAPLADAGVSIFVVSTYETDYVLVREAQLETALAVLAEHEHTVRE